MGEAIKVCSYYTSHPESILPANVKSSAKRKTLIKYLPTGTVLCALPFSNPLATTLRLALPQLLLGNCVLARHSSTTPLVGKVVENMLGSSGFESGEYQQLFVERERVPDIISHPEISGVIFAGTLPAASTLAQAAGRALKKCDFHFSGSNSLVLLGDGDVELAV